MHGLTPSLKLKNKHWFQLRLVGFFAGRFLTEKCVLAYISKIFVAMDEHDKPLEGLILLPSNYVERLIFSIKVLIDGKLSSIEILEESIMLSNGINHKLKTVLKMLLGFDRTGVVIFRKDFEKQDRLSTLIA